MGKPNIKQFEAFQAKAEERLGRDLFSTAGGKSKNHQAGALDFGVNGNKLTHKEYLQLGLTASEFGFRVGDERAKGRTHLHVDKTSDKHGHIKGNFDRDEHDISKSDEGVGIFSKMKREMDNGMEFDDAIHWGSVNDFSLQNDAFREEPYVKPKEIVQQVIEQPMTPDILDSLFKDSLGLKLTEGKDNPNTIKESIELGEITESNFRAPSTAFKQAQDKINMKRPVEVDTDKEFQFPIREGKVSKLNGFSNFKGQSIGSTAIDAISDFGSSAIQHAQGEQNFTGMGTNLGQQIVEESAVGLVGQLLQKEAMTTGKVDPNYNPQDDKEFFNKTIEGLSNEQVETLVTKHSFNESDFMTVSKLMHDRNQRRVEIDEYSKAHPVLSGVNFAGNMLGEAVLFSPVNRVIAAGGMAVASKGVFKSVSAMKQSTAFLAAEIVESGIGEAIKLSEMENQEFNPALFMGGVILGAGINKVMDDVALRRGLSEILDNEDGFIKMSTAQAKQVIKQVAKEADDVNAMKMVDELIKVKGETANTIRKSLKADHDSLVGIIDNAKAEMKLAKKGSNEFKFAKGEVTRHVRELAKLKKSMPKQFRAIADGTHEGFALNLNPQLNVKSIAKEFNIPLDTIDNPTKLRQFLGLVDSPIADEVFVQGEKSYSNVLRKQTEEMVNNKRLNMNTFLTGVSETMKTSPLDINNALSSTLEGLADTNSVTSKYLFNKANLVSSDNPLVSGFYNLLGSDGAGRQGMSKMRAGQTQQKYAKVFGGELMRNYRAKGDELFNHIHATKQGGNTDKMKNLMDSEYYEKTVEPVFNERLRLGKTEFAKKYSDDVEKIRIADDFAKDYNKLNKDINELLKRKGVEGVDFDSSEDFIHSDWDFNKARSIPEADLEDGIYAGMVKKLTDNGIEFSEKTLKTEARKFTFGIRNADISKNMEAQKGYIDYLEKLVKRTDDASGKATLKDEIRRLQTAKTANEAGDLGNRAMIDLNVTIPNSDRTLANIMEDNFIVTQKKYNQRMSARIAASEHGINDIDQLDEWLEDAIELETKRLAAKGVQDPARAVKHIRESMEQDLKSFKHGNMSGRSDLLEQDAHDMVRLANKYNFARLMQRVSIASIAELSGTINEVGLFNATKAYVNEFKGVLRGLKKTNPKGYQDELTESLSSITGIGLEDWAFTSRGVSGGERVFKDGLAGALEKHVDLMGTVTQGTLGGMETFHRKLTMNAIANKLGKHFVGKEDKGFLPLIFGGNKLSNRSMENLGLGSYDSVTKKVITNAKYDLVKNNFLKHAKLDSRGNLMNLNLKAWDKDAVDGFADTIVMQTSHIMVDPDGMTSALWQNSTVGKIASQYQSFSRNAKTKVFGYHMNNAAIGIERGDYQEVAKMANVMFVSSITGLLALSINAELGSTGTGSGFGSDAAKLFDDGAIQAMAVGVSRSSMIGGVDTLVDTVGSSMFGYDPIFTPSSFTGRGKNIGNLAAAPLGQLITGGLSASSDLIQGDLKSAGKKVLKLSPYQRQLGVGQLINYFSKD